MKKITKIVLVVITILTTFIGCVFASDDEYVLVKEYSYQNTKKNDVVSGFVEILIGSGDFVQYQDDEYLNVSPYPDEIKTDSFGNTYAYFDLSGLRSGAKFNIVVKRKLKAKTYIEMIPSRTNSDNLKENEVYLLPQERIDCNDAEIIAKAKELTEDLPSDYKKAEAIFKFINVNMKYDENVNNYENTSEASDYKGSVPALKNMRGVCEEFTTLFVAMCRAVNIPSRAVIGYRIQYSDTIVSGEKIKEEKLVDHVWSEIYLQDFGWVPVEPTVIYTIGSQRVPYMDSFCKIESPEYIATGIYTGKEDRAYTPILKELYVTSSLESLDGYGIKENNFEDLENYEWAEDAIDFLYKADVVKGYSDTEYRPQSNISRIEFISMLSRALKHKDTIFEKGGLVYYYPDYDQEHWSKQDYDYLMRCYQAITPSDIVSAGFYNIAEVFDSGKLDMNKPITRAEVVALMDVFLPDDVTITKLIDIDDNKFKKSICKAYNSGLIVGYPDMTFRPNNGITRAEMAVILKRYIGNEIYNIL